MSPLLVSTPPMPDETPMNQGGAKAEPVSDIIVPPEVAPARKEEPKKPTITLRMPKKEPKQRDGQDANAGSPIVMPQPEELGVAPPIDSKNGNDKKPMNAGKIDDVPLIAVDVPKAVDDFKKPMNGGKIDDIIIPPSAPKTPADKKPMNGSKIDDVPLIGVDVPKAIDDIKKPMDEGKPMPKVDATKADAPKQDNGYDEDIHPLKPNETYSAISKQYYNSDAYATALQRYNRDTPGGLANNLRVPPIWVLEKKYPADVANTGTRSVGYVQPAVDLPKVNEATYTVSENGEMIADVAKKTLGNDDYQTWQRIYTLNPQINPGKLIPGGTRLKLPDGTRTQ
jgi:hypothetical protein